MQNPVPPTSATAPLESVHRALTLLKALDEVPTLTVSEAADLLGVAPSTAHRLLAALCFDGFASQDERRRYMAGSARPNVLKYTCSPAALREAAAPVLVSLAERTHETVQLWLLRGARVRYVEGVEALRPLSVRAGAWDDVPAIASAAGRAMLAQLNQDEIERVREVHESDWTGTGSTAVKDWERILGRVRADGYAVSVEEVVVGVNGVARCLRRHRGAATAAVSVAIPTVRFDQGALRSSAQQLRVAVDEIEARLASATPP